MNGEGHVTCAVKKECADNFLTIADTNGEVCRNYEPVTCVREDIDEHTVGFSANVGGTTGERYSFAFCQILGDSVEFIIDWEGEGKCRLFLL
ncbi:unnamed protein product [Dibothriocephalus latus]|uniref:Uncharacterized protein n=1 Tax=Dibothriocephalus latus TaxID=60516 RepID=A0A3P7NL34_DIBLA|nr:unnamed protein product [Dibothriocephalus latus]